MSSAGATSIFDIDISYDGKLGTEARRAIRSTREMHPDMTVVVEDEVSPGHVDTYEFVRDTSVNAAFKMPTHDEPSVKRALHHDNPERQEWIEAIEREYRSLDQNNTWRLVKRSTDMRVVDVKLVLKRKRDQHGAQTRLKARLVIRGDQCGAFDKLTQLYTPVAQLDSFRVMCACSAQHDLELCQIDFTTAFLNSDLPTSQVYCKQGPGRPVQLDDTGAPMVYALSRSVYGLPFAPKLWHQTLHTWLVGHGWIRSAHDPCAYTCRGVSMIVYVDDCAIMYDKTDATASSTYKQFLTDLGKDFKFTGGGDLDHFLGYGITRDRAAKKLYLNQHAFIDRLLAMYDSDEFMPDSYVPALTGNILGHNLCPDDSPAGLREREYMQRKQYRALVGSLLWLQRGSRPDLSFVVGALGRVMHNPSRVHWAAAVLAMRYVRTTRNLQLTYSAQPSAALSISVDADFLPNYGDAYANWKSTTGFHAYLGGAAVSWVSRRQDVIATSTPHSECLAAYDAVRTAVHLRGLMSDFGYKQTEPTVVDEDNQSLVRIMLNDGVTDRIKHWDYKVHWLRERVNNNDVTFAWVNSADQMSDTATKPLPKDAFTLQRDHNLGIFHHSYVRYDKIFREHASRFDLVE